MKHIRIAPSILSCDFGILREELQALKGADVLHLDIMDGHYVPNLTFGFPIIERIRSLTDLPLDAHLMVSNPDFYIDRLAAIGVQYISFHQECADSPRDIVNSIKNKGIQAGIALNPDIQLSTLDHILPELDYVLLMSVFPGFSGQNFIPDVMHKIRYLRQTLDRNSMPILIEVDGGISAANSSGIVAAGADILVSASYIFSSEDYPAAIDSLRK
jgi:ribulose-phosphate 3-epimerase